MATPFSRTTRSLHADSYRASVVALLLAVLVFGAWAGWFFLARISLYEVSQSVRSTKPETIVSDFPMETQERIWEGQSASLQLDDPRNSGVQRSVPAIVMHVTPNAQKGQLEVELALLELVDLPSNSQVKGRVDIEVDRVSPATLVLRASGNLPGSTQDSASLPGSLGTGQFR